MAAALDKSLSSSNEYDEQMPALIDPDAPPPPLSPRSLAEQNRQQLIAIGSWAAFSASAATHAYAPDEEAYCCDEHIALLINTFRAYGGVIE